MYLSHDSLRILGKSLQNDYIFIRNMVSTVYEIVTGFINRKFYTQRVIEVKYDIDREDESNIEVKKTV
jgi:hypothetical protein